MRSRLERPVTPKVPTVTSNRPVRAGSVSETVVVAWLLIQPCRHRFGWPRRRVVHNSCIATPERQPLSGLLNRYAEP